MRNYAAILLLVACHVIAGCRSEKPRTEPVGKIKIDSVKVVRPDLEGAASPYVQEGMAYREERDAALEGAPELQYKLGLKYETGSGVKQDYQEAVKWYRLAAEQGLPIAQYILGARYFDGEGVTQDYQEAYYWVLLAMANGSDDLRGMRDYAAEQITVRQKADVQSRVTRWLEDKHRQNR